MRIRLFQTEYDGLCWAVCARGSWKPLLVFQTLSEAREAL